MPQPEFSKRSVNTVKRIVDDLHTLGVHAGDSVVVHSSFKSMHFVHGKPSDLIDALIEVLLPTGTLLLPNLNIPHEFTESNPPVWDLEHGSVRETIGVVPQTFKDRYATHFSIHPTHSMMGTGAMAETIVSGHAQSGYCCGPGTPWEKNADAGGKILLIGVDQHKNTTYHCAEERIPDSYQLTRDPIEGTVITNGKPTTVSSRLHVWTNSADFNRINGELQERGDLRVGSIGDAAAYLIDAAGFLSLCDEKLAANRRFFLAD